MKLPRREFLHLAAGAAALPAFSGVAVGQTYPSRSITMISGIPPGSGTDTFAHRTHLLGGN
jgi:tripartite-type tricarboxylate transporter receptor subunit TctC